MVSLLFGYLSTFIHPKTVSFIPLFGLAYWVIVIGNFILLIVWILLRSKVAFILGGLLLIGIKLHFRTFCFGWNDSNEKNNTEIKALSYNVRLFDVYNPIAREGKENREAIFDFLKKIDADIYCFQEFYHQDAPSDFAMKDTLKSLLKTEYSHTRFATSSSRRQEFGVVILSKHEIIRKGEVNFASINKTHNYCIYADIVKGQDTFRVYNTHLQSIGFQKDDYALFNEENDYASDQNSQAAKLYSKILEAYVVRADQAKKVTEHLQRSPYPVIICGDFNDTPVSYTYNQFDKYLYDAFRNTSKGMGFTYAGKVPAGRIDYIFHSESIGSRDFEIQDEKLSDHYAISCTLFKK